MDEILWEPNQGHENKLELFSLAEFQLVLHCTNTGLSRQELLREVREDRNPLSDLSYIQYGPTIELNAP